MKKYLKLLLTSSYLWYFGTGLLGPLYSVFSQSIGGDILDLTGAYAVYLAVLGVLIIITGKYTDKHHKYKERLMLSGYALAAVATFCYLLVDTPIKLFLVQGLLGVATAIATPTYDSLYANHIDKKEDGEEWGLSEGGPTIIMAVALMIGGLIVKEWGFTTLFWAMGVFQTIAFIVQLSILTIKDRHKIRK